MPGLTDMEELIATVPEKAVADYLREAMTCYGAGAYRACIVLTHVALFDGLRSKVKSLAAVNKIAKKVSDAIEPLAHAQKVFETPLIHQLKGAGLISELEAERLEQLNDQRNKAAHPSGHLVTAEEARFVFSEAIQKFLSKPIRHTTFIVDDIVSRIGDKNYFPTTTLSDFRLIVSQEIQELDDSAYGYLIAKLVELADDAEKYNMQHARRFLIALADRADEKLRPALVKKLIGPKASDDTEYEFLCEVIYGDPLLLKELDHASMLRVKSMLLKHSKSCPKDMPFVRLAHPDHLFAKILKVLGSDFVLKYFADFTDYVLESGPVVPSFVRVIGDMPDLFSRLFEVYERNAGSNDFGTANRFADALPELDSVLQNKISNKQAFKLLAAVVKAAKVGAFSSVNLANNKFSSVKKLKTMARVYSNKNSTSAEKILADLGAHLDNSAFASTYLSK